MRSSKSPPQEHCSEHLAIKIDNSMGSSGPSPKSTKSESSTDTPGKNNTNSKSKNCFSIHSILSNPETSKEEGAPQSAQSPLNLSFSLSSSTTSTSSANSFPFPPYPGSESQLNLPRDEMFARLYYSALFPSISGINGTPADSSFGQCQISESNVSNFAKGSLPIATGPSQTSSGANLDNLILFARALYNPAMYFQSGQIGQGNVGSSINDESMVSA